jgi:hypothetical protein
MRPLVSIVVCRSIRPSLSSVVALQIDEMMVDWSRNAGYDATGPIDQGR